jgi:Uma2 family endonuclease
MEVKRTGKRWTYAEFARLPTSGSTRYEVIDDELVVTPSPSTNHQRVVGELLFRLIGFVKEHDLGEVFPAPLDVLFAEGDYMEPDVLFVAKDRSSYITDRGVEGPPDLVVEVVSPSTAVRDRRIKRDRYEHFGVGEYWVVDPDERTVEVWKLADGTYEAVVYGPADGLEWSPVHEGPSLHISIAELFGS